MDKINIIKQKVIQNNICRSNLQALDYYFQSSLEFYLETFENSIYELKNFEIRLKTKQID